MHTRKFTAPALLTLLWSVCSAFTVHTVPTDNLPVEAKVTVAVPAGYEETAETRYPVVYLLNGYGGDHITWSKITDIDSLATVHDVIIVCPAGLNSWYWNLPYNPELRMESYITADLVPWVDANYRTVAEPGQRAITGLSMGGHGGLWLSVRHPEIFGNAGSTSGGVDITPFPTNWNLAELLGDYEQNKQAWFDHSVISLIDSPSLPQLNIIFDCGYDDVFYNVNNRLHEDLDKRGIRHTYLTSPGNHNSAYWSRSILPQFDFFDECFRPASEE